MPVSFVRIWKIYAIATPTPDMAASILLGSPYRWVASSPLLLTIWMGHILLARIARCAHSVHGIPF